MSNSAGILDAAFESALARAIEQDAQGNSPDDPEETVDGLPSTNAERVRESWEAYRSNRSVMDASIQGLINYLETPEGAAHAKALQASLDSDTPNELSTELATRVVGSKELSPVKTAQGVDDLVGIGLGASVGGSFLVGVLAGADLVFDFVRDAQLHGRSWYGGSIKTGISASVGIELSFWIVKPISGAITGWLIDITYSPYYFLRFMHIKQKQPGKTYFSTSGISVQVPYGIGFPVRRLKEKNPGLAAGFLGKQSAWNKPKRATLDVINEETGVSTIAVKTNATLQVTIKNTSGTDTRLNTGATMQISMPSYFTDSDMENMKIAYDGWTFSYNGRDLILTLNNGYTWKADDKLVYEITNVESSSTPVSSRALAGTVDIKIDTLEDSTLEISLSHEFDLVWLNSEATLKWSVTLNPSTFTLGEGQAASGTTTAYAQSGTDIIQLSTAVNKSNPSEIWTLGYVFNYNTATSEAIPQVAAAWYKQGSPKVGNNVAYSQPTSEDATVTCYYADLASTGSSISIDVTFDS